MPQIFISYPREYRGIVERLVADLRSSGYDPFFDEQLTGGQPWWDELLTRIEASTAFVPIIGPGYLGSTPCQLESKYAAALGKLFLPIAVEPTPPQLFSEAIASAHWAEYDPDRPTTVFAVIRAINELPPAPPLPAVMPARPIVPISYMTELQNEIGKEDEIGRTRQMALVADLKSRLNGPDKEAAVMLLTRIRQRPDVSYQAAVDIDELLTQHGPRPTPSPQPQAERPAPPPVEPHRTQPAPPPPQPQPQPGPQTNWPGAQPSQPGWPAAPSAGTLPATKPDNYYVWTILSCVLCCIPVGIVGIVYSSRVDTFWAKGQVAEAVDASNKAKMWAIISVVCGFIAIMFVMLAGA